MLRAIVFINNLIKIIYILIDFFNIYLKIKSKEAGWHATSESECSEKNV